MSRMKISIKAKNTPQLFVVWAVNVGAFSGIVAGVFDIRDTDALGRLLADVARDPGATWPYAGLLTVVTIFNGAIPRLVKERLVFWPAQRPGSRAFSHFMFQDSAINRKSLQEHFNPLPTSPDEQNALWVGWLHEFEDDARVRGAYGLYLFARDWTAVSVATLLLAGPLALWLAEDVMRSLWYGVALMAQFAVARWIARVQGEQLVMSVMSCKASPLVK